MVPAELVGPYVCSGCKQRLSRPAAPPLQPIPIVSPADEVRLLSTLAKLGRELPSFPPSGAVKEEVDSYFAALNTTAAGYGRVVGEINLSAPLEGIGIGERSTAAGRFAAEFVRQAVNVGRVQGIDFMERWERDGVEVLGDGEAEVNRIRLHRQQWEGDFARSVRILSQMEVLERQPLLDAVVALVRSALAPRARPTSGRRPNGAMGDEDSKEADELSKGDTPPKADTPLKTGVPFFPLTSWADIFDALNGTDPVRPWSNDDRTRGKLRDLNERFDGPIRMPTGQGKQPEVDRSALLNWWAGVGESFRAVADDAERDATSEAATVADTHPHGRSGTVVPHLRGGVKNSKRKGKV